jgi:hypothetical protein
MGQFWMQFNKLDFKPGSNWQYSDAPINFMDWHSSPDNEKEKAAANSGPFVLQIKGKKLRAIVVGPDGKWVHVAEKYIDFNRFTRVRVAMLDDFTGKRGMVQVWVDGQLLTCYHGPVGYDDVNPPYALVGLHQWDWPRVEEGINSFAMQLRVRFPSAAKAVSA